MSIDREQHSALNARDDLLAIADAWPVLLSRLASSGSGDRSGVRTKPSSRPPIDVHVSDLLEEITQSARFYGRVLLDEVVPLHGCNDACYADGVPVEECPDIQRPVTTSFMPGLLVDVATRYGHFTEQDDIGLAFCDDASDFRERVRKTLERPAPAVYVGPCRVRDCDGELYLRDGRDAGTCKACGEAFTMAEQREFLNVELDSALRTRSEIVVALKILGYEVQRSTLDKWVQRGRLVEAEDGLFRLADAMALMGRKGVVA